MASFIGATITSFHPPDDFFDNVKAIADQCDHVVVVDNASPASFSTVFDRLSRELKNVEIIFNTKNKGVATALNQGVEKLLLSRVDWIATFDHDTRVPENFFKDLLASLQKIPRPEKVFIVGPHFGSRDHALKQVPVLITSGSLHRAQAFRQLGLFKDELFIDCVDHEFCLRVLQSEHQVWANGTIQMQHRLGDSKASRLLSFSFFSSNYSPLRRYYMFRNGVIITKAYFPLQWRWFMSYWFSLSKEVVKILIAENNRQKKIAAILQGLKDGFKDPRSTGFDSVHM